MIFKVYRILQFLSIDIAFGAVILLHFFSLHFEVQVTWPIYTLLWLTVWSIYTFDHLRDAEKALSDKRDRYLFHQRNSRLLKYLLVLALTSACGLTFFIPSSLIAGGAVLVVLCLFYVGAQSFLAKNGLKEFYIAFMYACGIFITPYCLSDIFEFTSFFLLFVLAFTNLLLFSWMEIGQDEEDGFHSMGTSLGARMTEKLLFMLVAIGCGVSFSLLLAQTQMALFFLLAFIFYALVMMFPAWAKRNDRYRLIGDGVFILPIFF